MKKIGTLSILGASLFVASCSGDKGGALTSGSSGTSFGEAMTAQFIDAPVKGLKLKTASGEESQTGDLGKFSCKRGELVSFSLGGLDLGYAACGDKIFVQDLVSKTTHYSWDQAAAIIQTFSVNKTGYLDLSSVDQTQIDLSGVSYNATPANLDLSAAFTTAQATAYDNVLVADRPSAPVTVADATTAANNYISSNISLPTELSSVVGQLNTGGASSIHLDGTLISETLIAGVNDGCWKNIEAKSEVTLLNGVYSFKINSAVSYDNKADLEMDPTCGNPEMCETAIRLPKPKIITSENIDMIFSSDYVEQSMDVTEQNVLSLKSSIATNKVNFSGIYESRVTVKSEGPLKGQSFVCKYRISGSKTVQTTVSNGNGNVKYSGALTCIDGSGPINADVRAEVEVAGSFPGATASIKVFDNGNLAWSVSNLSFVLRNGPNNSNYYSTDGTINSVIGPLASGDGFNLSMYPIYADKLTFGIGGIGEQAVRCFNADEGLVKE